MWTVLAVYYSVLTYPLVLMIQEKERMTCLKGWCVMLMTAALLSDADALEGAGALNLWYEEPASEWDEALPAGNGRMGAMVFGGTAEERIQFNEESLWDGYPRIRINPAAKDALPEVRRLLFEGKNEEAAALAEKTMMGIPERINSYQSFGDLLITFPDVDEVKGYRRELDLESAIATTEYTADGVTRTREVFASHPHQIIAVRLTASEPGKLHARIRMKREQDAECVSGEENRLWLKGRINRPHHETGENAGLRFAALLQPRVTGGTVTGADGELVIENADSAVLLLAAATSFGNREPETACREYLADIPEYEKLEADHIADHQKLFNRVSLWLGEDETRDLPTDKRLRAAQRGTPAPGLEALYFQLGRYMLIASSRPGDLPANLQGIWNEHMNAPWNSDYHTNINLQMNYWPAEVTNLSECHLPLFDYMEHLLVPSGMLTAERMYGARGWVVHHLSDIFGFTVPADGIWGVWPVGAAWLAQHPWEHYRFTLDKDFLRTQGYPLIRGAALFMLDFLVEDPEGRLVTAPSHSPENKFRKADGTVSWFTYGATMDLMIAHELFSNCIEAAKILGVDADLQLELLNAREKLAPLQISERSGRLQEWIEDYEEPEPGHRHMSHLYGFHPGDQITKSETPAFYEAARKAIEGRLRHGGGHTGWSRAWIINFFARFGEGDLAHRHLEMLFRKSTLPNLFDSHPPFQIDGNFGATAGIAEMLLQSHDDAVHLLPALPAGEWPEGHVNGLQARGGYTVDMQWREGQLAFAVIEGIKASVCTIRFAEDCRVFRIEDREGRRYYEPIEAAVKPDKAYNAVLTNFDVVPGEQYAVVPDRGEDSVTEALKNGL
jgi:alpha-L-fucosidase 2